MSSVEQEQIAEGLRREASWTTYVGDDSTVTEVSWPDRLGHVFPVEVVDPEPVAVEAKVASIYIAGPMSGLPDFNYPAFHEAAERLRWCGFKVVNPAENHEGATDLPLEDYFAEDLPQVCRTDAVAVLPGWQQSGGASIEVALARHLGHPVLDAETLEPYHETALQEAQRLVHGDRGVAYGHPADDFGRTGKMWGAILGLDPVSPQLVGLCMAAVKISREVNAPKRDNRVDLAGYAETIQMIHERGDS